MPSVSSAILRGGSTGISATRGGGYSGVRVRGGGGGPGLWVIRDHLLRSLMVG